MDQDTDRVKRTAEAIAALLETMAQSARPRTLTEAARVIRDIWCDGNGATGLAVVPREATEAMASAGADKLDDGGSVYGVWRAMVDAAEGGR